MITLFQSEVSSMVQFKNTTGWFHSQLNESVNVKTNVQSLNPKHGAIETREFHQVPATSRALLSQLYQLFLELHISNSFDLQ
jgi:hypothetical protein